MEYSEWTRRWVKVGEGVGAVMASFYRARALLRVPGLWTPHYYNSAGSFSNKLSCHSYMTSNHLPALLAALNAVHDMPDQAHAHVMVVPGAPPLAALPAPPPNVQRTLAMLVRSLLSQIVRPAASLILRHRAVRTFALRMLALSPELHARAYRIMFPSATVIAVSKDTAAALDDNALSPRARAVARRLAHMPSTGAVSDQASRLPHVADHAGWDRFVAATQAMLIARGPAPVSQRPRLAFVSPLPPERTGIADYAVQLLPALRVHFDITLIVQQDRLTLPPELAVLPVQDSTWLRGHADAFDQILYQIGNSEFHRHMFSLLDEYPGVVVLHDFFLGNVMAYRQVHNDPPNAWTDALFHSHGYEALRAYLQATARPALLKSHPCNLRVLENASRIIVHSDHAAVLARAWYGPHASDYWDMVPLPRAAPSVHDRAAARAALGIAADILLVCSFGYIGQNKLTDRLLAAWMASSLYTDRQCLLVLVGANHNSPFGLAIGQTVRTAGGSIQIAGWTDDTVYRQYLQAADIGVQLRTSAQGETSAAVLDCMNYGLPTIVNANGSMADLPDHTVLRLSDNFTDAALVDALQTLRHDYDGRVALGQRAAHLLAETYRPAHGAALYRAALETARADAPRGQHALERELGALCSTPEEYGAAAAAIARIPARLPVRRLLVDASRLHEPSHQRARDDLAALLADAPGWRIEPVLLVEEKGQWRLRCARAFTAQLLGFSWSAVDDSVADIGPGDLFYAPVPNPDTVAAQAAGWWKELRARGVGLAFAVPAAAPDDAMATWRACVRALPALLICPDDASAGWLMAPLPDYNSAC